MRWVSTDFTEHTSCQNNKMLHLKEVTTWLEKRETRHGRRARRRSKSGMITIQASEGRQRMSKIIERVNEAVIINARQS